MSAAAQLLDQVRAAGGTVEINDGKVRLRAPSPLPDELVDALRSRKAEIIGLLTTEHASRIAARWGDLAGIAEWFLTATPLAEPFLLKRGVRITDPARWWRDTIIDIHQGPNGPRARYGALQDDLWRAWRMFRAAGQTGLGAITSGERVPVVDRPTCAIFAPAR